MHGFGEPISGEKFKEVYKKATDAFWKSFTEHWEKAPATWPPAAWLPMHDFPDPHDVLAIGETSKVKCSYCGTESGTTTRHNEKLLSIKGWPHPFVCTKPDPRETK